MHFSFTAVVPVPINETVVTASHAIFVEKSGHKAPAAVVGLQYKYSAFRETFFNITSGVRAADDECHRFSKACSFEILFFFLVSARAACRAGGRAVPATWRAT